MPRDKDATNEIEVTPEMLRARAQELMRYDSRFDSFETVARMVFEAMGSIAPRRPQNPKRQRAARVHKS